MGILLTFGYTLVKIHEAFFRERKTSDPGDAEISYPAMTLPEKIGVAILLGSALLIGLCPWLLTEKISPSLERMLERFPN